MGKKRARKRSKESKDKSPAAVKMGQLRWVGVSTEERSKAGRKAIAARWERAKAAATA